MLIFKINNKYHIMKLSSDIIVFVTGGASGLGEETVRRLHA